MCGMDCVQWHGPGMCFWGFGIACGVWHLTLQVVGHVGNDIWNSIWYGNWLGIWHGT